MFCRQPIHVARADVAAWVHCINMYVQLHQHVRATPVPCCQMYNRRRVNNFSPFLFPFLIFLRIFVVGRAWNVTSAEAPFPNLIGKKSVGYYSKRSETCRWKEQILIIMVTPTGIVGVFLFRDLGFLQVPWTLDSESVHVLCTCGKRFVYWPDAL